MSHGGNINQLRKLVNKETRLIDFSASINPLGAPSWLRAEIARSISDTSHYPDIDSTDLVAAAAQAFAVKPEQITPANGSSELIFSIPQVMKFSRALIVEPSYIDYRTACNRQGLDIVSHNLLPDTDFTLDLTLLQPYLSEPSLVFLAHPNNPTGRMLPVKETLKLIAAHPECCFIIDEAYLSFVSDSTNSSFINYTAELDNLIVLRSLTKFYAIAGLRLGLGFAGKKLTAILRNSLTPWSVNTLSQKVGARVLLDTEYAQRSLAYTLSCKDELLRQLQQITELKVFPSAANFILCRLLNNMQTPDLCTQALKYGIALRDCSDFSGLDKSFFRVAVRTPEENDKLIETLKQLLYPTSKQTTRTPIQRSTPSLMLLGCSSNAGKSIITAGICRILLQDGIKVAPFKSQNMALNSYVTADGLEMGRAQAVQAQASRLDADVRMNPILLKPNSDTGAQVIAMGKPVGNMRVLGYMDYKTQAFAIAQQAYDSLADEYEAIILEGAGSPGEVNLKANDIVNTRMAQYAQAPALLVGDIDRGGIYASFIGTYETFEEWERELVKGFLVNKFRGDASLLAPAHAYVQDFTGREVLGVIPYIKDLDLPEEDSVSFNETFRKGSDKDADPLDIALIALPHTSNFTDFDALASEPDVQLRPVRNLGELATPDCIIIPGSKNVIGDLKFLQSSGLGSAICATAKNRITVGICGGYQILGKNVRDPYNIEGGGEVAGLELLPITTTLDREKTLTRATAQHTISGLAVTGYEIHHGETLHSTNTPLFIRSDDRGIGSGDEQVWGTYLHGVFDNDEFRRYFINSIHKSVGRDISSKLRFQYNLEPAFDRLAATIREAIDIDSLYKMMGL